MGNDPQGIAPGSMRLAVNRRGAAGLVWGDAFRGLTVSARDAGGGFRRPHVLGDYDSFAPPPVVTVNRSGAVTVAWVARNSDESHRLMTAYRPPHGTFGPPEQISPPGQDVDPNRPYRAGATRGGHMVITWPWLTADGHAGLDAWIRKANGQVAGRATLVRGRFSGPTLVRGGERIAWTRVTRCGRRARAVALKASATGYGRAHRFPFVWDFNAFNRAGASVGVYYDSSCGGVQMRLLGAGGKARRQVIYRRFFYFEDAIGIADNGRALVAFLIRDRYPVFAQRPPHGRFGHVHRIAPTCDRMLFEDAAMSARGTSLAMGAVVNGNQPGVAAAKLPGASRFGGLVRLPGRLARRAVFLAQIEFDASGNATAAWHVPGKGIVTATLKARALRKLARAPVRGCGT